MIDEHRVKQPKSEEEEDDVEERKEVEKVTLLNITD